MISESEKTRLKEILRINSVQAPAENGMPFGKGAYDCLVYALDMMQKSGLTVKNIDGYCGWGEIGEGDLFGILCHLDVVPVGKGWRYPPFGATEENGKIYARGALDDKGPFMAAFFALERLLDEGLKPKKRIRFILGCNEESGWACMDRYKETEEMPALGFSPDADFPVINGEKDGMPKIAEPCIAAMRGRDKDNPNDRGKSTDNYTQRLELKPDGTSNTLTSVAKDNLLIIPQATKEGYAVVPEGGVFDASYPDSTTRRGRVQEGGTVSPTIMASQNELLRYEGQVVIGSMQKNAYVGPTDGVSPCVNAACGMGGGQTPMVTEQGIRIRRLTERELYRLMDVEEKDIDTLLSAPIPRTQHAKLAGNSIVVACLYHIFRHLFVTTDPTPGTQTKLF